MTGYDRKDRCSQEGRTEQEWQAIARIKIMEESMIKLYEEWRAVQPLPKEHHQALYQWIRMRCNHLSNNFEGNTLTYSETQLLLIHGRTTGDHTLREYEEMKAHDTAFEYIQKLAKEPQPIRETDIRDLNKICLKEPFYKNAQTPTGEQTQKKIIPGEYKKYPNHVLTSTGEMFHFATPEETPPLMKDLTKWIQIWLNKATKEKNQTGFEKGATFKVFPFYPEDVKHENSKEISINIVSFLAELHKRFILIHPFDDGNGRVIRLLMNYILMRLDFLPMVLTNREEYIKAIQFSDAGDKKPIEKLFTNNIIFMLKKGIYAKTHRIKLADLIDEESL